MIFASGCSARRALADLVAVHSRQVAVEHDDVVGEHARLVERVVSRLGHVHRDALTPQAAGDGVGDARLVLGDQYPHGQSRPAFLSSSWFRAVSGLLSRLDTPSPSLRHHVPDDQGADCR